MKTFIILPGKIGDVLICLPIAKFYADQGDEVIWPVYDYVAPHYEKYVDYVKFVTVSDTDNCIQESLACTKSMTVPGEPRRVIDLSFTNKGCWGNENTEAYLWQNLRSFDEFRYYMANVPFEKKWDVVLNRIPNRIPVPEGKFCLVNLQASDMSVDLQIDAGNYDGKIIQVNPSTDSILDWIPVLKAADKIILIDSCLSAMVEQLGIENRKQFLVLRPNYYGDTLQDGRPKGLSLYKGPWTIIE